MHPAYQVVRSLARKYSIEESLPHIWEFWRSITFNKELPFRYKHVDRYGNRLLVKDRLHEFQLYLLLREILLNGSQRNDATRSISDWDGLSDLWNTINQFGEAMDERGLDKILMTMHRLGHQQISIQERLDRDFIGRYWALYSHPQIKKVFEEHTSLTLTNYFTLAIEICTNAYQKPCFNAWFDLEHLGISKDHSRAFFLRLSSPLSALRTRLIKNQSFTENWSATFNDYSATPLISINPKYPEMVYCPIPSALMRRLFQGLFYDVSNAIGFATAFGEAFEDHVGKILERCCPTIEKIKPKPYTIGKKLKHGADWILVDDTANIFIECKTMRIRVSAKSATNEEELAADLEGLAKAIVQNYANIIDAKEGRTDWTPNNLPSYSMIVTLEDWLLFSPASTEPLHDQVMSILDTKGISSDIVSEIPYEILSAAELQIASATFNSSTIQAIMSEKTSQKYGQWKVSSFLGNRYAEASARGKKVFQKEFEELGLAITMGSDSA
ncbi:hypothetical protein VDR83_10935 [Xanthomonas campestris pv. campestris]|nr:hypothetical protein [Xanthomonas campestris pv. campestris]